jgi:hypothetical protein
VDTVLVRERGGGGEGGTYAVEDEGDGNAFPEGTAVPLVQRPGDQREESSDEESLEHASGENGVLSCEESGRLWPSVSFNRSLEVRHTASERQDPR